MSSISLPAVAAPPPLPTGRNDFPTWLPAMLVKELRQGLRTRGFVGAFIVFQVIMVLLMVGTVFGSMFSSGSHTSRAIANTITGFFWTLLGAQMLLSTPARALGTLQVELDSRALDLLVLTRLTAWRIVLGKWGSLMAQALLLFVAMLPYGIVRYFMGSVDLVQDAQIGATLIGGCALLTAAGLACSGLPKIVRVLVPIVLVMGFQVVRPLMMLVGGGRTPMGSPFGSGFGSGDAWVWWVNGALVLGIFLVTAVRRIAPPAENHVLLTRGLALAAVLPVPVLVALTKSAAARGQLIFAAMLLGIVGAIELSSMRWPMRSHWQPWTKHGPLGRWVGRLALPGWPSAFAFMVIAGLGVAGGVALPNVAPAADRVRAEWLVVLAVSSLVFPAMLLSFFGRAGRSPGALYGLVLGVSSLLAAIAGVLANGQPDFKPLLSIASVLPAAGFWITLFAPDQFTDNVFVWQAVVAVILLGLAWWRARIYWNELARIDAQRRSSKK